MRFVDTRIPGNGDEGHSRKDASGLPEGLIAE